MKKERFLIILAISILLIDVFLVEVEHKIYSSCAMDAYLFLGADAIIESRIYSYFIFILYFFSFIFLHPSMSRFRWLFLLINIALVFSALLSGFLISSPIFVVTGGLYFILVGMLAAMEPERDE